MYHPSNKLVLHHSKSNTILYLGQHLPQQHCFPQAQGTLEGKEQLLKKSGLFSGHLGSFSPVISDKFRFYRFHWSPLFFGVCFFISEYVNLSLSICIYILVYLNYICYVLRKNFFYRLRRSGTSLWDQINRNVKKRERKHVETVHKKKRYL